MSEEKRISKKYNTHKRDRLILLEIFLAAVVILFLVFRFVIGLSRVSGSSMLPTMKNGDVVVFNRLDRSYEAGDVISIKMPSGDYYVKRIVAVAGDTVEIDNGTLYINGRKEESTLFEGVTQEQDGSVVYPLILKEGEVFVLGDNREASVDSRTYGPMAISQIRGKILGHWSISKGEEAAEN